MQSQTKVKDKMKELKLLREQLQKSRKELQLRLKFLNVLSFDWSDQGFALYEFDDEDWKFFEDDEGRSWRMKKVFSNSELIEFLYECDSGVLIPPHKHPDFNEKIEVLEGILHLYVFEGEETTHHHMKPGDTVYIPKNIGHKGYYPDKSACRITCYKDA